VTGRRLLALVAGLVVAGSVVATGCSTSNSATVTSTPTPASTLPFETPTPSPSPTVTPTVTPTPSTATPTASPTPSKSPKPAASPTPSTLAKPVNTQALIRGLGTTSNGRYTITYDPVVVCTKAGVQANEAPKQCKPKPSTTAANGSWTVRTTTSSVVAMLAPTVSGTVYPAGVSFDVTVKNLAKQKVRNGVIFDWSTVTVPALLTVAKNEIETVAGSRPSN
jgi:hypothetical protein